MAIDDRGEMTGAKLLGGSVFVAERIAAACASRTVGVLLPTGAAFPMAALAAWSLGKVVVPLNYLLKPEELQYVVDDCEADTIVTAGPLLEYMKFTPKVKNLIRLDQLSFTGVPELRWPRLAGEDDLAVLLYTSGTSGRPKGVMLTHGNLTANIEQILEWINMGAGDTMLGVLPQFHSFGLTVLTLLPLAVGMKIVYTARFVPHKIVNLIRTHRPTVFVAIPSMYAALLSVKDASPEDFESLRIVVSGGEPLPDAVTRKMRERFRVQLNEGYGLTETSPVTNWCRPGEYRAHSVGMPLPRVRERIVDPGTGGALPAGREGEVQIAGPNVMRGYYKLEEETARAFTSDGYFRTGDMGRFDHDGHLYITGRIKEMMIIGGENVFPREIEEVLNKHDSVAASGVVGRMDQLRGEVPVAFVEMKEGASFDETALKGHCRAHLAGYKVPDAIVRMDALPRNATGKIMRRELKKSLDGLATAR